MQTTSNIKTPQLNNSVIRQLSKLTLYKSILTVLMEWIIIILCIAIHLYFKNIFVYILVYIVISTRLYALYSLIHEASHHFILKNRLANDVISQMFLGFPLFMSLKKLRAIHFAHHKYVYTEKDPEMELRAYSEFSFPKSKLEWIKILLFDLLGINFLKYKIIKLISCIKKGNPITFFTDDILGLALFFISLFVGIYFNIIWEIILCWWLPYATLYQLINRLRLSTEHFNIDEHKLIKTRTVIPTIFQKLTIIPHNLGYHTEHHLYPGIPFYNLPQLHEKLKEDDFYKRNASIENGFLSFLSRYIK